MAKRMQLKGLREGDVVAGRYRIEATVGRGSMGLVLAATDLQAQLPCALKVMLDDKRRLTDNNVRRFQREAQAAAQISSPHAVKVWDTGNLPGGEPFMVMELLYGEDLQMLLARTQRLYAKQAADGIVQALHAIAEAHALGIIHRDLKPANLFFSRRPGGEVLVKVLDFGISKMLASDGVNMTGTQTILGSPRYMSPEQIRSTKNVDVRTDVWALGVILYEMLTGAPPFAGKTLMELCMKVAQVYPPPPAAVAAGIPHGLSSVVMRCLEKRRNARYASAQELTRALAPYRSRGAPGARSSLSTLYRSEIWSVESGAGARPLRPSADERTPRPSADERTLEMDRDGDGG